MVRFSNDQCPRVCLVQGYPKKFWPTKSSNKRLRKCAKTVKKGQKTRKSRLTTELWRAPRTSLAPAFGSSKLILNRWVQGLTQGDFRSIPTTLPFADFLKNWKFSRFKNQFFKKSAKGNVVRFSKKFFCVKGLAKTLLWSPCAPKSYAPFGRYTKSNFWNWKTTIPTL